MTARLAILGAAIAAWLVGFALLLRLDTWAPFAVLGPALAAVALRYDAATRALLRPTPATVSLGVAAGLGMLVLTHAAYALLAPSLSAETIRLYALLEVGGFSPAVRAGLVVVIASSEEILFRGALLDRRDPIRVVVLALAYALAMATLGSVLLIVSALCCALVWGAVRVATRSLVAPILTHVVWDLGVLVLWPLIPPG